MNGFRMGGALAALFLVTMAGCSAKSDANGGDTSLPIDCREETNPSAHQNDLACNITSGQKSGTVGTGVDLPEMLDEGFVDNGRIIFGGSHPLADYRGIFALDPETKERTVISGKYLDPKLGTQSVGTGPEIINLRDLVKGPDGYYAIADAPELGKLAILKIDPANGNRTMVLDLLAESAACLTKSGRNFRQSVALIVSPYFNDYNTLEFGPDGTMYTGVEFTYENDKKKIVTMGGIGAIKDGKCTLISVWDPTDADSVGSGREMPHAVGTLRRAGNALYATGTFYGLMKIDIATGNREIFSSAKNSVGEGPEVHRGYVSVAPDGRIWSAGGDISESLLSTVDLTTANRTGYEIALGFGKNGIPLFGVHPTKPYVYVGSGKAILVLEYTTGNANILAY